MAPRTSSPRPHATPYIPEHLIHTKILPLLQFKTLCRLKLLSKKTNSLILEDAKFAMDQFRSQSPSSTVFAFLTDARSISLSFFPNRDNSVRVPDPKLRFLGRPELIASSNGLHLYHLYTSSELCVCNPATRESTIIPDFPTGSYYEYEHVDIGLAYDPSRSRYAIVRPYVQWGSDYTMCKFLVYLSQTKEWVQNRFIFCEGLLGRPSKPLYANGRIYWSCSESEYLLWYDAAKNISGCIKHPPEPHLSSRGEHGSFNGLLTYCFTSKGGIEGWVLIAGSRWEKKQSKSWDDLLEKKEDGFVWPLMCLHGTSEGVVFYGMKYVKPLVFDGRNAYVTLLNRFDKKKKKILECDLISGIVVDIKVSFAQEKYDDVPRVFEYKISMARLPS